MRKRRGLAVFICVMVLLAGCGGKSASDYNSDLSTAETGEFTDDYAEASDESFSGKELFSIDSGEIEPKEASADEEKQTTSTTEESDVSELPKKSQVDVTKEYERKLIRTVDIELASTKFDRAKNEIEVLVGQKDGYLGNAYLENQGDNRFYSIEARIPKEKLDDFLAKVTGYGFVTVRSLNQTAEDITLNYVDTADAKKSLEKERSRIIAMIDEADSIEYLIQLEDKLSELNTQIASYERTIRNYDNKVDYSTVNLRLYETTEEEEEASLSVGERMSSGFLRSIRELKDGMVELIIFLVVASPYLLILAALLFIFWFLVMRSRKNGRKQSNKQEHKKERQEEKKEERNE